MRTQNDFSRTTKERYPVPFQPATSFMSRPPIKQDSNALFWNCHPISPIHSVVKKHFFLFFLHIVGKKKKTYQLAFQVSLNILINSLHEKLLGILWQRTLMLPNDLKSPSKIFYPSWLPPFPCNPSLSFTWFLWNHYLNICIWEHFLNYLLKHMHLYSKFSRWATSQEIWAMLT